MAFSGRTEVTMLMLRVRALSHAIGRRGASLLWFGLLDLLIGISLLDPGSQPRGQQAVVAYKYIASTAPYDVWAWAWILVGLSCVVQAVMKDDRLAFSLAIALKLTWGTGFFASALLAHAYRGWVSVAIWYSLAAFVGIIAGWPEPVRSSPSLEMPAL